MNKYRILAILLLSVASTNNAMQKADIKELAIVRSFFSDTKILQQSKRLWMRLKTSD